MTRADHLVLVGMMGAGKSTVGRVLAERRGEPFVDTDDEIERRAGSSVATLFAERGEEEFRRLEAAVLAELLAAERPAVLACGGGVVTSAANRRALRERATVVWLTAPVDVLARRVGDGRGRPLLGDEPEAALAELLRARRPFFEEVADHAVDTSGRSPGTVADRVARAVA